MEQCLPLVVFFAAVVLAVTLYQRHTAQRERANFRVWVSGTQSVIYNTFHQVRGFPLTWARSQPNIYTLCANKEVLAVLYLDIFGSLVGAESADGLWAVEGEGRFSSDFSLRQVQSQIDVVKLRSSSMIIEFPTGRAFQYKPTGILRAKLVPLDDSSEPLIFIDEKYKMVEIEQRAYSMPELPFLVLLGGYLAIFTTDYSGD